MENINWIALIAGALVPTVVGFLWYSPFAFHKTWQKSVGLSDDELKKGNMAVIFGVAILIAFLVSYFIQMYVGYHKVEEQTFTHGAFHAMQFCVMIGLPVLISNSLFERRSWTNIMINSLYWLVTFALMGGVIGFLY